MNYEKKIIHVENHNALIATIKLLNDLEKDSLNNKEFQSWCINTFANAANGMGEEDFIKYIWLWCNSNLKYKEDDFDETLIAPKIIIHSDFLIGDCDDFSLLIKTILSFYGIKSNYILFAKEKGYYTHIANIVDIKNKKIYIDGVSNEFNNFPYGKYNFYKII